MDQDAFRESFSNALHYMFTFGDTSANVDRVVQFIATFCTSLDDEEEFLFFIFEIIFKCQCVSGQSVRYRASQLLAAVLQALGEDASLDDDLCDKLLASQMQRLQDARGAVRCRAALALQRLQNPLDPDDEVTRAYRFHMSCDPSSSVRRAIVMSIAKCTRNVPFVLERLCDVDEAVRRAAFLYISAINVMQLKVRQRVLTLKVGLTERSLRVRRVVEEILIPSWLSSFKGNVIDLLKAIRLDNIQDAKDSQYVAGKLLDSLFKRLPVSELLEWLPTDKTHRLIPAEKLNKETAWYWRHLAEHLNKLDDDETLESILPDLVVLAGYIRAIVEVPCPSQTEDPVSFNTRQYILHECASLLQVYDAGDQVGRTALQKLIYDVLTGDNGPLNPEVIRAFVSALELVLPEISPRVEFISGVISELREPSEPDQTLVPPAPPMITVESTEIKMQRAKLRVSLNVAMEAQEEAVRDQNYALAAECKAKVAELQKKLEELNIRLPPLPPVQAQPSMTTIREKACDSATLNKCLTILNSALDTAQITGITPLLDMIFKELEVEIFKNVNVIENALETVALYGMLDKKFAQDYKDFFFAQLVDLSDEKIVTKSLTCIVDLLCVHGLKVFDDDVDTVDDNERSESNVSLRRKKDKNESSHCEEDGTISESAVSLMPVHSTVVKILLKAMEDPCSAYRLVVVEGFCRLFMLGHLESPGILSRLLLLWFNPATAEEDMLRQTIGVFFQSFVSSVDGAQEQIQKATLPTLRALANAPSSSPIAEIDQEAVFRFIVSLTRVNHEAGDSQAALALLLCSHLTRRTSSYEASLICRILALLSPPRDAGICVDLAKTLRKLCEKTTDKQSCRNLTRYLGALEAVERSSLNKQLSTGQAEGTMASEDLTLRSLRATGSLPQPQARSTHVIINETVEEEKDVDIDESSPTDPPQTIIEEPEQENVIAEKPETVSTNLDDQTANHSSSGSEDKPTDSEICDSNENVTSKNGDSSDSSSGISPEKKQKISKRGRKNLSLRRSQTKKDNVPKSAKKTTKAKTPGKPKLAVEVEEHEKGVKRTRSQRSLVDVDRARENQDAKTTKAKSKIRNEKEEPATLTNVTIRRSTRSTRSSTGSESSVRSGPSQEVNEKKRKARGKKTATKVRPRSVSASPASSPSCHNVSDTRNSDETELHTIVYEQELVQSLLDDSEEGPSLRPSGANVTVPESPEMSNTSDSEEEFAIKSKGKGKSKK
ncbi:Condensin complex subunit 3 [Eumeta japonica]|uniref:Condensin complex subunit 3 n=1 Tax=Eumeta variegata TaxID=151549 RepID=A0A4C1XPA8_EUMVA|nr:Condensin complex subunit 3 [Eumeta japonica]